MPNEIWVNCLVNGIGSPALLDGKEDGSGDQNLRLLGWMRRCAQLKRSQKGPRLKNGVRIVQG
ncbi:hypothetical protein M413DRAFT_439922 [Hebeloma cylindrosporum]|uniref:Uncharacterized protein n=1 Tax=Hebeloma cylindrosporum TaxID=76867 RepID=A0A0C2YEK5_HEBCY|nr:hypothetical protein M413DRAFT_439922 [Hebeloma cylindrosporum h7]